MYNSPAWIALRRSVLNSPDGAVCYLCGRELTTVCDHFIPHRGDPQLFYDRANLKGACKPCHDWKTYIEQILRNHWREVLLRARRTDLEPLLLW